MRNGQPRSPPQPQAGSACQPGGTTDRRAHALYLTPAGKAAAKRFDRKVGEIEARIRGHLGDRNSRELKRLLKNLEAFFAEQAP